MVDRVRARYDVAKSRNGHPHCGRCGEQQQQHTHRMQSETQRLKEAIQTLSNEDSKFQRLNAFWSVQSESRQLRVSSTAEKSPNLGDTNLETSNSSSSSYATNNINTSNSNYATASHTSHCAESALVGRFYAFLEQLELLTEVLKNLLKNEAMKSSQDLSTAFGEDSIAVALLTAYWNRKGGTKFLQNVVRPAVAHTLKVTENTKLKLQNYDSQQITDDEIAILDAFLELTYHSEPLIPNEFKEMLRSLNASVSLATSAEKLPIVTGVLLMRIICPALAFPDTYGLLGPEAGSVSLQAQRSLVLVSKNAQILARNAGLSEQKLTKANMPKTVRYYMRKQTPRWRAFCHYLLTGVQEKSWKSEVFFPVTAEELVGKSNKNLTTEQLKNSALLQKQSELVEKVLQLEKQSEYWKESFIDDIECHLKFYKDSNALLAKSVIQINRPSCDVWDFMRREWPSKDIDGGLVECRLLEQYSDNLKAVYTHYKFPLFLSDRDVVVLLYSEFLPESKFGIVSEISVTRDDAPEVNGRVRAETTSAWITRENSTGCTLSYIIHADIKGWFQYAPSTLKKKTISEHSEQMKRIRTMVMAQATAPKK